MLRSCQIQPASLAKTKSDNSKQRKANVADHKSSYAGSKYLENNRTLSSPHNSWRTWNRVQKRFI